jgi:hypothetical protein
MNSKFYIQVMVQQGTLYTLGERGPLFLENSRDAYIVYAASYRILAVCRSLALAVHAGVRLETELLNPTRWYWDRTCWRWVREVGAGHTRWRWARNVDVGL